jgi:predicted nucleic acid-binding protein
MKVLLDTNVVIGFFRNPGAKEEFESRTHRPLLFMSSVVTLELLAGCRTSRQETALANFLKPFEKAARIITPDHACFREAGRVLAGLGRDQIGTAHRRQIVNDVLIAVTAARSGAVVVTSNARDFALIEKRTPMRWMLPG